MSKGYQAYKPRLRIEFSHKCGYCEIREPEIGGAKSFHIDHYKPQKLFPHLINDYDNLIYACRDCNGYKRDYWPNIFEILLEKIIINPRKDKIEKHINISNFTWVGITPKGKWTVEKLKLDSPALCQKREDRARIEQKILEFSLATETRQKKLIGSKKLSSNERDELQKSIEEDLKTIESFKRKITGPMD